VVEELGSEKLVVFKRETQDCKLSTIILRGSTRNLLEDIERAIDDAINVYRSVLKDPAFVPGAGSTEMVTPLFYCSYFRSSSKKKPRTSRTSSNTVTVGMQVPLR